MTTADEKALIVSIDAFAWRVLADALEERGEPATEVRRWRWMATIFEAWLWYATYGQGKPPMNLDGRFDLGDGFHVKIRRSPSRVITQLWRETRGRAAIGVDKFAESIMQVRLRTFHAAVYHLEQFDLESLVPPSAYRKRFIRKKLRLICDEAENFEKKHGVRT